MENDVRISMDAADERWRLKGICGPEEDVSEDVEAGHWTRDCEVTTQNAWVLDAGLKGTTVLAR